jgi:hypothetical protein
VCETSVKVEMLFIAWSVLEYWLGKTSLIKSGSTLELIFNTIKSIVTALRPKTDETK